MSQPIILLIGPTAVGKTNVAMALQDLLGGTAHAQLISADSAMVYRGMDIGSAKPSETELMRYPHALINIRDPEDPYTAADFVVDADRCVTQALAQGQVPIIVGGTMLYVKRFVEGIADLPPADPKLRQTLAAELQQHGAAALHTELTAIDPVAASNIHPNNHQRLLRALEVVRITGQSLTRQWQSKASATATERLGVPVHTFAIVPKDRSQLHERIAQRFDAMLDIGFVDELERLRTRPGVHAELPALRCVGYRQGLQYLAGTLTAQEFRDAALTATRRLAKRQLTWLRQWPDLKLLDGCDTTALAQQIHRQVGL